MFQVIRNLLQSIKYKSLIWGRVKIHETALVRYSIIRGPVLIGPKASVYRGDLYGSVTMQEGAAITGPGVYIHCVEESVTVGAFSSIAPAVTIITSGHCLDAPSTSFRAGGQRVEKAISIGGHCWLGAGAILAGGACLEDYCVVAAGAVMPAGNYEGGFIWGGVPAQPIRRYRDV